MELETSPDEDEWEKISISTGGAHEQSYPYGEVNRHIHGSAPIRIIAKADGRLIGCIEAVGKTRFPGSRMKVGGMSGGPILDPEIPDNSEIATKMVQKLESLARRRLVSKLTLYSWDDSVFLGACRDSGYSIDRSVKVFEVDMGKGPDYLWESFKSNKRRKIRQANKRNISVVEPSEPDIEAAHNMMVEAAKRGGFKPISRVWLKAYINFYGRSGMASIYFADMDEKPVSCALVVRHGKHAFCPAAGSLPEGWPARPNDLMHWEIMKSEYEKGIRIYNMGGVNTDPESSSYGVYQWKKEYGGRTRDLSVLSKDIIPFLSRFRSFIGTRG